MRYGWNLEKQIWRSLPDELLEGQWRNIPFKPGVTPRVPDKQGIYIIVATPPKNFFSRDISTGHPFQKFLIPLYVGRTKSLKSRFQNHLSNPKDAMVQIRRCFPYSAKFWYLRLSCDVERLRFIEDSLIDCFGPIGNDRREIRGKVGPAQPVQGIYRPTN